MPENMPYYPPQGGSINPDNLATLALFGRGGGGYGGYGGGYGGGGHGREFANDGSNAVRINSNRHLNDQGQNHLSRQIAENGDRSRDIASFAQDNANFNRITDKLNDSNNVNAANFNTMQRELAANAREAAACCCAAKLLAVENQAKTDAKLERILANQDCVAKVAQATANAEQNAKQDIILAELRHRHH